MDRKMTAENLNADPLFAGGVENPKKQDLYTETHYLLQCHRIALDFGPGAAEMAISLFADSDTLHKSFD